MEKKTVFVTGAVRNTGLAVAEKFAKEGYNVALSSRVENDAVQVASMLIEKYGIKAKGYQLSMRSVSEIKDIFSKINADFGGLSALVLVAGNLGMGQETLTVTEEQFDNVFDVNAKGNFFCAQSAAYIMKEQGKGSIVFIGSVHERGATNGRVTYSGSKGALSSMARNMAFELAKYGIRVNTVVPGAVRTDRWVNLSEEEDARHKANWPLGFAAEGEDIANTVYFLTEDTARAVTGAEFVVDSGVLTCLVGYNGGKVKREWSYEK